MESFEAVSSVVRDTRWFDIETKQSLLRLALQVGGNLIPAKNLTKKNPPIFRVLLDVVECISQFFLGLLQCIFHV